MFDGNSGTVTIGDGVLPATAIAHASIKRHTVVFVSNVRAPPLLLSPVGIFDAESRWSFQVGDLQLHICNREISPARNRAYGKPSNSAGICLD